MGMPGSRTALAALSALAATAGFTAPADATVFNHGISVQPYAHIDQDGTITLSGSYHCDVASPVGAVQIKATVIQDNVRLTIAAGDAHCDGAEHGWTADGTLRLTPGVHGGRAVAAAQLQEIHFSGLMPKSIDTVAEDTRDIEVIDHR